MRESAAATITADTLQRPAAALAPTLVPATPALQTDGAAAREAGLERYDELAGSIHEAGIDVDRRAAADPAFSASRLAPPTTAPDPPAPAAISGDGDAGSTRLLADMDAGVPAGVDTRTGEVRAGPEAASPRGDPPRAAIAQIVEVARRMPDGPVEISLAPEELGKVRLSLHGSEVQLTVQITAERPETLELIRRHIDLLAADLREQGFGQLNFSFGDSGARSGARGDHPHAEPGSVRALATDLPNPSTSPQTPSPMPGASLNLRL
jgi:hypothetical protein